MINNIRSARKKQKQNGEFLFSKKRRWSCGEYFVLFEKTLLIILINDIRSDRKKTKKALRAYFLMMINSGLHFLFLPKWETASFVFFANLGNSTRKRVQAEKAFSFRCSHSFLCPQSVHIMRDNVAIFINNNNALYSSQPEIKVVVRPCATKH